MVNRYQHFAASVSCINRYIQRIQRDAMKEYGLKGPHAQCLVAVSQYSGEITVSQLSKICDKDKGGISRALSELEEKGLIERISDNGNIYRAKLQLTEEGRRSAERVNELACKAVEMAGAGLTESQRAIFYDALDTIALNLQKLNQEGLQSK